MSATATVAPETKTESGYLAGKTVSPAQIQTWVEQFNRDGYLFLQDVLPPDLVAELRADLDAALSKQPLTGGIIELQSKMFETSAANRRLFDLEPIVTFAEALVSQDCHVVHNNSFQSHPGKGIVGWHQDDAPHFLVTEGEAPKNIKLPCLLFTANYYLSDVTTVANGPTEVIPGSHLFGKHCPGDLKGTEYEAKITPCLGKAGSVVMFNNQVWHHGALNTSDTIRYMTQISYARRLIGHKYYPFMNYQMPEHVYAGANPRLKRLYGFLPSGAYG